MEELALISRPADHYDEQIFFMFSDSRSNIKEVTGFVRLPAVTNINCALLKQLEPDEVMF